MANKARFEDRRKRLFGREKDIEDLLARVEHKGLTAMTGRPKIGKSWLLEETARRLTADHVYLVGFARSSGEGASHLLQAVKDLYMSWLAEASFFKQGRAYYAQHKGKIVGTTGVIFGKLFEASQGKSLVCKLVSKVFGRLAGANRDPKSVGKLVSKAFEGLAKANADLKSGGIVFPTLNYDQARELVSMVGKISGKPIVLVFDAWEKSPSLGSEAGILRSFLDEIEHWPHCHILVSIRADEAENSREATEHARRLTRAEPRSRSRELSAMDLGGGEAEHLLAYLREKLPVAGELSDEQVLELVQEYPGVICRWVEDPELPETLEDLQKRADEAFANRNSRLLQRLEELGKREKRLVARVALMPELDEKTWGIHKTTILDGEPEARITELRAEGIFSAEVSHPSFGHSTDYEAARNWFLRDDAGRPYAREQAESLIVRLGSLVTDAEPDKEPIARALAGLHDCVQSLGLPDEYRVISASATAVHADMRESTKAECIALFSESACAAGAAHAPCVALISMGLLNTLYAAKQEDDLKRRDKLLMELRSLAAAHGEDVAARKGLAMGLFNTLIDAEAENDLNRRDELLKELQALAAAHADDAAVRENFAKGLFNTLLGVGGENEPERRDLLLEELRALAADHADDAAVRDQFAGGLCNALNDAKEEDDLERRDELLEDLRALAAGHTEDAAVREKLAMGLYNTLVHAKEEDNFNRRDELLKELRALAAAHADDAAVREKLAMGLSNTLVYAKEEDNFNRRDELLEDLRALAAAYADDAAVREKLAIGLFNTLIDTKAKGNLERRDELLEELRALAVAHAGDAAVRENLANGLFNTLLDAKAENNLERRDELLGELRALAAEHAEDAVARETLSKGLRNTLVHAKEEEDLKRRDELLEELRALVAAHPGDAAVRTQLGKGLLNALHHAKHEGVVEKSVELTEELREFIETYPDDPISQEVHRRLSEDSPDVSEPE